MPRIEIQREANVITSVADALECSAQILEDLVVANRIAVDQGLVDGFGHLSARHDKYPERYLMTSEVAPGLVQANDVVAYDLESVPILDTGAPLYWERFIHGEIYKARPDVHGIVHSHSLPLILLGTVNVKFQPVFHMASFLHVGIPTFDIHDAAGATDLMVRTPELGVALAGSLADKPMVLMRGHGATIVGMSIKQAIWRSIYAMQNAQLQSEGMRFNKQKFLYPDEAVVAAANITALERPWSFWRNRALQNTGALDA